MDQANSGQRRETPHANAAQFKVWMARRDEIITALIAVGLGDRMISQMMGISHMTVHRVRKRIGGPPGKWRPAEQ